MRNHPGRFNPLVGDLPFTHATGDPASQGEQVDCEQQHIRQGRLAGADRPDGAAISGVIDASASTQASGRMDKRRVMDVWFMAGRTLELKIQGRSGTAEKAAGLMK